VDRCLLRRLASPNTQSLRTDGGCHRGLWCRSQPCSSTRSGPANTVRRTAQDAGAFGLTLSCGPPRPEGPAGPMGNRRKLLVFRGRNKRQVGAQSSRAGPVRVCPVPLRTGWYQPHGLAFWGQHALTVAEATRSTPYDYAEGAGRQNRRRGAGLPDAVSPSGGRVRTRTE